MLSPAERRAADGHLAECAACRRWFEGTKAACQRLKLHPVIEAQPGFDTAVMARVTAGPFTRVADALDNWICTPARQIAAAAAGALALSALLLWGAVWVMIAISPPRAEVRPPVFRSDFTFSAEMPGARLTSAPPRPPQFWPEFLRRRMQPQRPEEQ